MKLPYSMQKLINKNFLDHAPGDWASRKDWMNYEGVFSCCDGRFKIIETPEHGKVIVETKNVSYGMGGSKK